MVLGPVLKVLQPASCQCLNEVCWLLPPPAFLVLAASKENWLELGRVPRMSAPTLRHYTTQSPKPERPAATTQLDPLPRPLYT